MPKNPDINHDIQLVTESYDLIIRALKSILKADPSYWGPRLSAVWPTRVALVRYILKLHLNIEMKRRTISSRIKDVEGQLGSAATVRELEATAGIVSSSRSMRERIPTPRARLLPTSMRELLALRETYEIHYVVKIASNDIDLRVDRLSEGGVVMASQLHPFMLNVKVLGRTLEDLELIIQTPWRIQSETIFTIQDDKPRNERRLKLSILSTGLEDNKFTRVKFPNLNHINLPNYNLAESLSAFHFFLTPNSHFVNLVLACVHDEVAPISALRVYFHFQKADRDADHGGRREGRSVFPDATSPLPVRPSSHAAGLNTPVALEEGESSNLSEKTPDLCRYRPSSDSPSSNYASVPSGVSKESPVAPVVRQPSSDYWVSADPEPPTSHSLPIIYTGIQTKTATVLADARPSCPPSSAGAIDLLLGLPLGHPFQAYATWERHVTGCSKTEELYEINPGTPAQYSSASMVDQPQSDRHLFHDMPDWTSY